LCAVHSNSEGKGIVSVGASGLFYSSDSGLNWKQLAKDPSLYTLRFIDNHTAIAAGKIKWCVSSFEIKKT
jgi:hypothetical protein